ncbi:MAG: hypothetical protein GY952_11960 [Rhodobacteraceae bacterium]|nr:hypothetical protein [Paracoccaceae bacterium]
MMRYFFCLLTMILVLPLPGYATPDRLFDSTDRLVAATQTHLYVVRDMRDNQGSHYTALVDQHLVEIEIDGLAESRSWLLRSMLIEQLVGDGADFVSPGVITDRAEGADIYGVLRSVGAAPMRLYPQAEAPLVFESGLTHPTKGKVASVQDIAKAARAQLEPMAKRYPQAKTEEEYIAADKMEVYDLSKPETWQCEVLAKAATIFRPEDKLRVISLACDDDYLTGMFTFHMVLPAEIWD